MKPGTESLITSNLYVDLSTFLPMTMTSFPATVPRPESVVTKPMTYVLFTLPYENGVRGTTEEVSKRRTGLEVDTLVAIEEFLFLLVIRI